jgi:hypothetical protein
MCNHFDLSCPRKAVAEDDDSGFWAETDGLLTAAVVHVASVTLCFPGCTDPGQLPSVSVHRVLPVPGGVVSTVLLRVRAIVLL